MPPALAQLIVDRLDKALPHVEVIRLHLYGGEPLTNLPALEAMVRCAQGKGSGRFRFTITTNGVNDSPQAVDLLEEGHFYVVLSLDGPQHIHDECRRTLDGSATHAAVLSFLQKLRSRTNCMVRASAVIRSGWSLAEASAYLHTLPVDSIKAQAVRVPPASPFALKDHERRTYMNDLAAIGNKVILELEAGKSPLDDRFSARVLQLLMGLERSSFCGAAETTFGITPDGTILPCVLINPQAATLGHITDDPGMWLANGHNWKRKRRFREQCRDCPALPLCGGGCPAMMPVCGDDECDLIRKNCEVATSIYEHFSSNPRPLLALAGIT